MYVYWTRVQYHSIHLLISLRKIARTFEHKVNFLIFLRFLEIRRLPNTLSHLRHTLLSYSLNSIRNVHIIRLRADASTLEPNISDRSQIGLIGADHACLSHITGCLVKRITAVVHRIKILKVRGYNGRRGQALKNVVGAVIIIPENTPTAMVAHS